MKNTRIGDVIRGAVRVLVFGMTSMLTYALTQQIIGVPWYGGVSAAGTSPAVSVVIWAVGMAVGLGFDTALAYAFGVRDRKALVRSAGQMALLWLYLAVTYSFPDDTSRILYGIAALTAFAGAVLFDTPQAPIAWLFAGPALLSAMNSYTPGLIWLGVGPEAGLLASVPLVLSLASLGALALFARSAMRSRAGLRRSLGRVGLAFAGIAFSLALTLGVLAQVAATFTFLSAMNQYDRYQMSSSQLALALEHEFSASQLASPTPEVTARLEQYATAMFSAVTLFDLKAGAPLVAIRFDQAAYESDESTAPTIHVMEPSAQDAATIVRAIRSPGVMAAGVDALSQPAMLVGWSPIKSAAPAQIAVVVGPLRPETAARASGSDNVTSSLIADVFPWIFLALLLPTSIALLVLQRRDEARAELLLAEERARLNRDAHDRVYNRMIGVANDIEQRDDAAAAQEIRGAVRDMQRILGDVDLRVGSDIDAGTELLDDAIADQSTRWGLDVTLTGREALAGIDPRVAWELQCIVDEALTNAGRHASAQHATVAVSRVDRRLRLEVSDDGTGMAVPLGPDGLPVNASGLRGMSERVRALGGTLSISATAGGLNVVVEVPV